MDGVLGDVSRRCRSRPRRHRTGHRGLRLAREAALHRAQLWRTHEQRVLDDLAEDWAEDRARYFARAKAALADVEELLRAEDPGALRDRDAAWDAAPRRTDTSTDRDSSD